MRDYALIIPPDCTASNSENENNEAIDLMRKFLKADTRMSATIRFRRRQKRPQKRGKRKTAGRAASVV